MADYGSSKSGSGSTPSDSSGSHHSSSGSDSGSSGGSDSGPGGGSDSGPGGGSDSGSSGGSDSGSSGSCSFLIGSPILDSEFNGEFAVTNTGTVPLELLSVTWAGGAYYTTAFIPSTIAPGAAATVFVSTDGDDMRSTVFTLVTDCEPGFGEWPLDITPPP